MGNKYAQHSKAHEVFHSAVKRINTRQLRSCTKKRPFETEEQAIRFLRRNNYVGTPYLCPECLLWHNTTKHHRPAREANTESSRRPAQHSSA